MNNLDHIALIKHIVLKNSPGLKGAIYDSEEFSDACLGYSRALQQFDSTRGVEFQTYAYRAIENEIWQGKKRRRKFVGKQLKEEEDYIEPSVMPPDNSLCELLLDTPGDNKKQEKLKYILREMFIKSRDGADLAKELNLSRERIRQLKEEGLAMLRDMIK